MANSNHLSINEKQGRLISTHNLVPIGRDLKNSDADKAFARAQGKLKSTPVSEYREEIAAENAAADAKVATQDAEVATVAEEVEKKTEAKQSKGKKEKKTADEADDEADEG